MIFSLYVAEFFTASIGFEKSCFSGKAPLLLSLNKEVENYLGRYDVIALFIRKL